MDAGTGAEDPDREYSRPPTLQDLKQIATYLNEEGCRYAVLGGMAVIQHGFTRATMDIDIMVDPAVDNMVKVIKALGRLPDHAALELTPEEIQDYTVIRVNDEVTVDLLASACGLTLAEATKRGWVVTVDLGGVPIPYLTPEGIIATKNTYRPKDRIDVEFLQGLL
ncbi:MAG TPA: hypothetical protein VGO93_27320 [Candidatus Xenobia bacterium]|jgi:hypothetical protein